MARVNAEHILQVRLKIWVREAVISRHKFFAFDRTAARGQWTHALEKARGIQRSTPDTLLVTSGLMFWAELKDPRLKLDNDRFAARWPDQWQMGQELIWLAHPWAWFQSISAYYRWLDAMPLALAHNARFLAEREDATVASLIEQAEMKAGKLPVRLKEAKPTVAQVRRFEKARALP